MLESLWHSMPWLEKKIFDNSILDCMLAALTFLGLWFFFAALKPYLLRRLNRYLSSRYPKIEGVIEQFLTAIHPAIIPLLSLHFALQRLTLNPTLDRYFEVIVLAALVLQLTAVVTQIVGYLIMHITFGRSEHDLSVQSVRLNLRSIMVFAIWTAAILFFLSNLGINITTFVTGLGIGGIAIALAAQSILGDVFSSFTIALDKPFEVGDSIKMDDFQGTVELIGLKTTRLRSVSGETIVLPNSDLTKARLRNFKRMNDRRVVFAFGVSYETPLDQLKDISHIVKGIVSKQKDVRFDRAHFLSFGESSLNFEVVYIVLTPDYNRYCDIQQAINLEILQELEARKVQMPYPNRTIHVASMPPLPRA